MSSFQRGVNYGGNNAFGGNQQQSARMANFGNYQAPSSTSWIKTPFLFRKDQDGMATGRCLHTGFDVEELYNVIRNYIAAQNASALAGPSSAQPKQGDAPM
jgi:hypothetical protein